MNTLKNLKPEQQTEKAWSVLELAVKYLEADPATQEKIDRILEQAEQEKGVI